MGLEEPDGHEEGLGNQRERLVGDRRDLRGTVALNLDHIVNSLDYSLMNSKWLQNFSSYDLLVDGLINTLDFAILKSNFGLTWYGLILWTNLTFLCPNE